MITSAKIEDATALTLLINSAYRGESSKKGWTTEATILEGSRTNETEILEIIKDSNQTLLKFVEDKTILGCVLLIEKESKLYLGMLTVSPELQNSGIGKKLLAVTEDHANQIGLKRIVMTVISIRKE
ncbi:MAG: GNAT family N-acetyltransferase, partial [Flavobacterium sp.]|nr:GNAT family N-acetyltransferase [Flavobacterium sp.]